MKRSGRNRGTSPCRSWLITIRSSWRACRRGRCAFWRSTRSAHAAAPRECRRYHRDVRLGAHPIARTRAGAPEADANAAPAGRRTPEWRAKIAASRVAGGNVPLLRRSPRAFAPHHLLGHDARQSAAALRDLLRRRSRHHGSRQSRRSGSRRPVRRPQHPASSRAVLKSLHHAAT